MRALEIARSMLTHRLMALGFRLYLGALFIYASVYKINYTAEFAETIANYQLVPYWAVNPMAIVLPWLELIAGLLLVAGIRSKAAAALISFLLSLFTVVVLITLARDIPIGCGCFHSLEDPISWKTVVRDLCWLIMALHVYRYDSAFQLERKFLFTLKEMP